jgi:hypothetical protein
LGKQIIQMSETAPIFLIIVDEDRKQFTVEGPLREDSAWKSAINKARDVAGHDLKGVGDCEVQPKYASQNAPRQGSVPASTRTPSTTASSTATGASAASTRPGLAPPIYAGSGRCTPQQARKHAHLKPSGHARRGQGRVRSKLEAVEGVGGVGRDRLNPGALVSDPCTAYTSHPEP